MNFLLWITLGVVLFKFSPNHRYAVHQDIRFLLLCPLTLILIPYTLKTLIIRIQETFWPMTSFMRTCRDPWGGGEGRRGEERVASHPPFLENVARDACKILRFVCETASAKVCSCSHRYRTSWHLVASANNPNSIAIFL